MVSYQQTHIIEFKKYIIEYNMEVKKNNLSNSKLISIKHYNCGCLKMYFVYVQLTMFVFYIWW